MNHSWLPPAVGSRWLGRGLPSARFMGARVAFVGGMVRDIHGRHRAELLAFASRRWAGRFARFGHSGAQVWGDRLSQLCTSVPVIVGDSAPGRLYWSDRVPCLLGRGGVLAHPDTDGFTGQGFTSDCMILYPRFRFAEMADRIDAHTTADLRRMSDAALDVVAGRHLWTHRLRHIAEVVGLT